MVDNSGKYREEQPDTVDHGSPDHEKDYRMVGSIDKTSSKRSNSEFNWGDLDEDIVPKDDSKYEDGELIADGGYGIDDIDVGDEIDIYLTPDAAEDSETGRMDRITVSNILDYGGFVRVNDSEKDISYMLGGDSKNTRGWEYVMEPAEDEMKKPLMTDGGYEKETMEKVDHGEGEGYIPAAKTSGGPNTVSNPDFKPQD